MSEASQERILDAAEACIGRSGFAGATMKDIAAEASVSKALVHYHFESKEQLLLEVQARAFRRVADLVSRLAGAGDGSIGRGLEALDRVWDLIVASRDQVPFSLELWSQSTRKPELRERLERFTQEMMALMKQGIRVTLGPQTQELPLSTGRLARLLYPLLSGLAMQAWFVRDPDAVEATYRDFRMLLEKALSTAEGSR